MSVQVWRDRAACRVLGPRVADAVFFPQQSYVRARLVCGGCPVRGECLADALAEERSRDSTDLHGMRGGLTPPERGALLRAGRVAA